MKHGDGKALRLAKVMKIMQWNDGTDAPSGVGAHCIKLEPKNILCSKPRLYD